jgi:ATP-dependent Clp protease protease subunit
MSKIFEILATESEYRLQIFGAIGNVEPGKPGFTLETFRSATADIQAGTLIIEMNSNGGDPIEAFAIHDAIKAMPVKVIVRIMGMAASAATIIAAAADEVEISENSRYLVHNVGTTVKGKKEQFAEAVKDMESLDNQMTMTYQKRTGKSRSELEALMKEDRTMTAQEALAWGFVDKIINNKPKLTAMSEKKEPTELEVLQAENAELKSKLEALMAKLKSYDEEKETAKKAEVEATIEAAITAGKITAEAKAGFQKIGLADFDSFRTIMAGLKEPEVKPVLAGVPNPKTASSEIDSKEKFDAAWKKGLYAGQVEKFNADYQKFYQS